MYQITLQKGKSHISSSAAEVGKGMDVQLAVRSPFTLLNVRTNCGLESLRANILQVSF